MTAPVKVTVEGEPLTLEVTRDQVRAYLWARGWEKRSEKEGYGELWVATDAALKIDGVCLWVGAIGRESESGAMGRVLGWVAAFEERHPSAVLRDIAATPTDPLPAAVRAMSPEQFRAAAEAGRGAVEHAGACGVVGCPDVDRAGAGARERIAEYHGTEAAPLTEEEFAAIEALARRADLRALDADGRTGPYAARVRDILRLLATVRALQAAVAARIRDDVNTRAAVGAREGETTVDAAERGVAFGRAVLGSHPRCQGDGGPCGRLATYTSGNCDRHRNAGYAWSSPEYPYAKAIRALGVDPDA